MFIFQNDPRPWFSNYSWVITSMYAPMRVQDVRQYCELMERGDILRETDSINEFLDGVFDALAPLECRIKSAVFPAVLLYQNILRG